MGTGQRGTVIAQSLGPHGDIRMHLPSTGHAFHSFIQEVFSKDLP